MHTIDLTDSRRDARGRNGWFQPVRAEVCRREAGDSVVSVTSRRPTWPPPIYLELPDRGAAGLAAALLQELTTDLPVDIPTDTATTPIEIEWHPDYQGGDWADMGELTVIAVPWRNPRLGVTDAAVNAAFEQQVGQPAACIIRWVEAEEVAR